MRIAVDGRKLSENKTGIGNYVDSMLESILKIDKDNEYFVFSDKPILTKIESNNVRYIVINKFNFNFLNNQIYQPFWLNVLLPPILKKYKIDIFWGPNFVKPISFPAEKSIITIHDLAFIDAKEFHSGLHSYYLKVFLRLTVSNKINILTVSEYSKNSILKHFPKVEDKNITVTYCSYNKKLFNRKLDGYKLEKIRDKYKLPDNYLLFVGTTTARKNLINVIKAMKNSIEQQLNICDLVVVGAKGNGLDNLKNLINRLNISSYVHFLGYVEDGDLPYIYNSADVFIFPSHFEGFGIPILEAMASDTPVITSNVTSLPEVGGDAVILINPHSPEEISLAINEVLDNETVIKDMVTKGSDRIKYFNWNESANEFLKVINQIK